MKLLLTSTVFHPGIGGVENIVQTLSREFARLGHSVTVATSQKFSGKDDFPFQVCRQPDHLQLMRLYSNADGVLQFGGVRLGWPGLLRRMNSVAVHQIWPRTNDSENFLARWLRRAWLLRSRHVCPSEILGRSLEVPFSVIPNPYDAGTFQLMPSILRDRDLIFVGRLIHEKGADIFLEALAELNKLGRQVSATIVGDGPMQDSLMQQTHQLGLKSSVTFTGAKQGKELAAILNAHKILVAPSRWQEPFGIVALEGIACGCVVVGSSGGGLPEAIGPCGVTFPNGDAAALAEKIEIILKQPDMSGSCQPQTESHLTKHQPSVVAQKYLEIFRTDHLAGRNEG